jgi:peptide/nickel transport system permease protein
MITDGLQYALTGQWWISLFPGLGVLVTATAAGVFADRLRDRLDPRFVPMDVREMVTAAR